MAEPTGAQHGDFHASIDDPSVQVGTAPDNPVDPSYFGRMFAFTPPVFADEKQKKKFDQKIDEQIASIASKMAWEDQPADPSSDSQIPAGYTILGQFITHDLTFDTTPLNDPLVDKSKLVNHRIPQLDLDSVYKKSPRLALKPPRVLAKDGTDTARMLYAGLENDVRPQDLPRYSDLDPRQRSDLFHYPDERAIIGDIRNDDNILLSQLHLAFLKLHNIFVGYARANELEELKKSGETPTEEQVYEKARQLCQWHYQWIVVNDFLPRIVDQATLDSILAWDDDGRPKFNLVLYKEPNIAPPSIPVEFSAAAFRFGHSMVRSHYRVNKAGIEYPLFPASPYDGRHLGGARRLPPALEVDWQRFFFDPPGPPVTQAVARPPQTEAVASSVPVASEAAPHVEGAAERPNGEQANQPPPQFLSVVAPIARNFARKLDSHLTQIFQNVPDNVLPPDDRTSTRSLAERDLRRGLKLELPPGKWVAQEVKKATGGTFDILSNNALGPGTRGPNDDVPLWFYLLKEAEKLGKGEKLGPVGGRIVAEVILGVLQADEKSYFYKHKAKAKDEARANDEVNAQGEDKGHVAGENSDNGQDNDQNQNRDKGEARKPFKPIMADSSGDGKITMVDLLRYARVL